MTCVGGVLHDLTTPGRQGRMSETDPRPPPKVYVYGIVVWSWCGCGIRERLGGLSKEWGCTFFYMGGGRKIL